MALFDDPKKELQRLQRELLAEEEAARQEEAEAQLDELVEEYLEETDIEDCFEEDYEEEYEAYAPRYRNFANDYGRAMTEALWEEEQDRDRVLYEEDYRESKKKKKKKMSFGEALLLILLDVALVGFLYWGWQNWIR